MDGVCVLSSRDHRLGFDFDIQIILICLLINVLIAVLNRWVTMVHLCEIQLAIKGFSNLSEAHLGTHAAILFRGEQQQHFPLIFFGHGSFLS